MAIKKITIVIEQIINLIISIIVSKGSSGCVSCLSPNV